MYYATAIKNSEPEPGCMLLYSDSASARWRLYYRNKLLRSEAVAGDRAGYRALNRGLTPKQVIDAVRYHRPERLLLAPETFAFYERRLENAHILYRLIGAFDQGRRTRTTAT
jgi:hypothetical protein